MGVTFVGYYDHLTRCAAASSFPSQPATDQCVLLRCQFANVVLEHAYERVIVGRRFSDVPLGLYVIRGENVVLLGQMVRAFASPLHLRSGVEPERGCRPAQDEVKEEHTTETLMVRVEVEDILEERPAPAPACGTTVLLYEDLHRTSPLSPLHPLARLAHVLVSTNDGLAPPRFSSAGQEAGRGGPQVEGGIVAPLE